MSLRRALSWGLAGVAAVWGLAYGDLVLRARDAYREGEKHLEWARRPELKKAHYDAWLAEKEAKLRLESATSKLSAGDLDKRLMLARFEHGERLKESDYKYAVVWFQTVVELFSPPESRWVRLARERLPEAKALWKKELDAKKIPYQDYMLE